MFTVWLLQVQESLGWNWIISNVFDLKDKARLESIGLQPEIYLNVSYYFKESSAKNALTCCVLDFIIQTSGLVHEFVHIKRKLVRRNIVILLFSLSI